MRGLKKMEQHELDKLNEVRSNIRQAFNAAFVYLWEYNKEEQTYLQINKPTELECRQFLIGMLENSHEPGPWTPEKPDFPWAQDGSSAYTGVKHGSAQRGEDSQAAEPTEEQLKKLVEEIDDIG